MIKFDLEIINVKVNNASYNTSVHLVGRNKLIYYLWFLVHILFFLNPFNPISSLKIFWLKAFGAKIGKGVVVKPGATVKYPWKLTIGNDSWIGENVWIDNVESITIGESVCISQGALLLTGSHDHTSSTFDYQCAPINIEDGVWIGAKSIVGKGITCKSHSILGINSVAEKNMEEFVIYKGNPAMALMKRKIS